MFNKNSIKNRARRKNKTSKLASQGLLAGLAGALLLNEDAVAQIADGVDVLSMDGIASAVLQGDDTLLVTLDSGQAYSVPVGGFEASGSQFLVPANFLDTLPAIAAPAATTGGPNLALIGLGIAAIGGAAAALGGGGGGDDAPSAPASPPPPPPPVPNEAPDVTVASTVTIAENTAAVTSASATDANAGDTLTFSLSGTDSALFNINSAGDIAFVGTPDFEDPGDAGADNVFDITVNVSDGALTDSQDVTVTVTDVNEAPVITAAAAVSVAEGQTAVQTASATDVDEDTLSFSLSGTDAALFSIDAATGAIAFVGAPDFETPGDEGEDNVFDITVNVSDGALTDSQDVAVTVTNLNEAPVITAAATASVAEGQTAVATATATDVDADDTLTFSLTGADAALFTIDAATGAIAFAAAPDFETPGDVGGDNVYDIIANVADADGLTDSQAIAVTVTDVNEAPEFTSGTAAITVDENTNAVTTVAAMDIDGDAVTFSLSGTDGNSFAIDPNTGVITFVNAPDFENPVDAGADNVFDIIVNASDGTNTVTQNLSIDVNPIDEAPAITNAAAISVEENQTNVLTATATDPEAEALSFALTGVDADFFAIDAATGVITFAAAPDFESPGDADGNNVFDVIVNVSDEFNSTTQALAVTVTDVIETIPTNGTQGPDNITGTPGDDIINGLAGDDNINSGAGDDEITGGLGSDMIRGDAGNDIIFADFTDQALDGGAGIDTVDFSQVTNPGTATITMDDVVILTGNLIILDAEVSASNDVLGLSTIDFENVIGTDFADFIVGTEFTNTLNGGDGDDLILGLGGDDMIFGGAGDDFIDGFGGDDIIDGGAGTDTVRFESADELVIINNGDGSLTVATPFEGTDTLTNIEVLVDQNLDNIPIPDPVPNRAPVFDLTVTEGEGAITFDVGGQNPAGFFNAVDPDLDDVTYSVSGVDADAFAIEPDTGILSFVVIPDGDMPSDANGDNIFEITVTATDPDGLATPLNATVTLLDSDVESTSPTSGPNDITGTPGDDNINGLAGDDIIEGGAGDDEITGGPGQDVLIGNAGDDIIFADFDDEFLDGGAGIDTIDLSDVPNAGTVNIFGDGSFTGTIIDLNLSSLFTEEVSPDGATTISNFENAIGTSFMDLIIGTNGDNIIDAGDGDDIINSLDGDDTIDGGAGIDAFVSFDTAANDFTVVNNGDGSLTVSSPLGGTNTLTNVEFLLDAFGAIVPIPDPVDEGGTAKPTADFLPADDALIDPAAIDEDTAFVPMDVFEIA